MTAGAADRSEAILARLRDEGGRITPSRRAVVAVLLEADGHLTADEVADAVAERVPDVSVSTVYRTLDVLERLGEVEHLHVGHGHGPARYHLAGRRHVHLLCRRCGQVQELPVDALDRLGADLAERYGFSLEPAHFALLGTCSSCGAAGSAAGTDRGSNP